jgi:hypothetical protein
MHGANGFAGILYPFLLHGDPEIGERISCPMGREGEAPAEPLRQKPEKRLGRSLALPLGTWSIICC